MAAEVVVTQRRRPLGASLDLGVLLGDFMLFNKDGEFSHLIFFSNSQRRRSSINWDHLWAWGSGEGPQDAAVGLGPAGEYVQPQAPPAQLRACHLPHFQGKLCSKSHWDVFLPLSLYLVWCHLIFPTHNSKLCSGREPKQQQQRSSWENRSLLWVSAQVSLIRTARKTPKHLTISVCRVIYVSSAACSGVQVERN